MKLLMQEEEKVPENQARMKGGAQANAWGKFFENLFLHACLAEQIAVTRIPDGCKQVSATKLIRVPSPWDYVMSFNGFTAFIDTKTSLDSQFSTSLIKEHQVVEMAKHQKQGAITGYVIWLRKTDQIFFMDGMRLHSLLGRPGSITENNPYALRLGTSRKFQLRPILYHADGY